MSSLSLLDVPAFRKHQLYLEFSSLKDRCPDGIYLSLTPGDPSLWLGVIFNCTGPYAPAVLRLQISFPDLYPDLPLLITFSTDIFHPLVVPLTTYTFSTGAAETNDTVSATDEERLPSGAFSLRHGFPQWFGRSGKGRGSQRDSRRASNNIELAQDNGSERPWGSSSSYNLASTQRPSILKVLEYVKASFGNPTVLDDLPLEAAANPGAWHAWRSHRGLPKAVSETVSPTRIKVGSEQTVQKKPGDWNWEGVWEKRASSGIEASISEATLFGGPRGGSQSNDMIRFRKIDEEQYQDIKNELGCQSIEE